MSLNPLGFSIPRMRPQSGPIPEQIISQRPLQRVLSFLGYSIDDVINDPITQNQVCSYYKLEREVHRRCEVVDLERWWNSVGMRL